MNFILRIFLPFGSVSFFMIVYLIQNDVNPFKSQLGVFEWLTFAVYAMIPFMIILISLWICRFLPKSSISKIISIDASSNDFLDNYFAFFFVALSVNGITTFWVIFIITIIFTYVSRVSYFNPVFLVFGFKFYYIQADEKVKVMLISRKLLRHPKTFDMLSVRKINDYTFINI